MLDFGENFVLGSCEVIGEPAALWTTEVIRERPKARSTCYSLQATSDPSSFDFEGVSPSLELLTADRLLIRLSEVDGDLRIVRLSDSCLAWLSPSGGLLALESTLSGDAIRD